MQYILTNIKDPIPVQEFDGEITLLEAKFWPAWQGYPETIATYNWKSTPYTTRSVKLKSGEMYKLKDILDRFNTQLNEAAQNDPVASLIFKNGYVALKIKENTQINNLSLNEKMAHILHFPPGSNGPSTEPVNLNSSFNNTKTLSLECTQIDDIYLNGKPAKTLKIMPVVVELDGSVTANLQHPAVTKYHNNFLKKLTFRVRDEHGNDLPLKAVLLHLIINDKRLSRQNLS